MKNKRFGRLVAVELAKKNNRSAWLCQCDCGNTKIVRPHEVVTVESMVDVISEISSYQV